MAEYRVVWEIDIEADSPREAAEKALEIQRDENSIATYFKVFARLWPKEGLGYMTVVDFHEEQE